MAEQQDIAFFEELTPATVNDNIHAQMTREWQSSDESLPQQTVPLRELCGVWLRVLAVYGPKDLGNGPVYAIDVADDKDLFGTTYVGSRQIVDKLSNPKLPTYLGDYENCMMLLVQWHERGDKGYYTATVWFGPTESGNRPSGNIG